ncbi:hypothetical protein BDK51DRAFT_45401 [Blyttiomyces helicus]|uniref:Uncharacterized protein n=1 Tax=Blyttiomyces helicus TaxID=388810 RepID=A0A4P9WEI1_9FUNG|nr:hypothetical protein BDK51DRAFT_45401 [Blyttiomyces helicus]|eukprot:RKO90113.1 hypothetical protein BDK51DRAFT_45401 [Blyttiomyces helicus]
MLFLASGAIYRQLLDCRNGVISFLSEALPRIQSDRLALIAASPDAHIPPLAHLTIYVRSGPNKAGAAIVERFGFLPIHDYLESPAGRDVNIEMFDASLRRFEDIQHEVHGGECPFGAFVAPLDKLFKGNLGDRDGKPSCSRIIFKFTIRKLHHSPTSLILISSVFRHRVALPSAFGHITIRPRRSNSTLSHTESLIRSTSALPPFSGGDDWRPPSGPHGSRPTEVKTGEVKGSGERGSPTPKDGNPDDLAASGGVQTVSTPFHHVAPRGRHRLMTMWCPA